jgi:hypothetical protein
MNAGTITKEKPMAYAMGFQFVLQTFCIQWSRGESNPSAKQSLSSFYACSRLFNLDREGGGRQPSSQSSPRFSHPRARRRRAGTSPMSSICRPSGVGSKSSQPLRPRERMNADWQSIFYMLFTRQRMLLDAPQTQSSCSVESKFGPNFSKTSNFSDKVRDGTSVPSRLFTLRSPPCFFVHGAHRRGETFASHPHIRNSTCRSSLQNPP